MITIFCNFGQFSAKKMAFFSKTNVRIHFLHNLALFWVKNAIFFAKFFGENIQTIITSVPAQSNFRKLSFFNHTEWLCLHHKVSMSIYTMSNKTRDQCYDFKNIFAEKFCKKLAFFTQNKAKL
jgi:hypothetical protein